jgi:hypothetical protein
VEQGFLRPEHRDAMHFSATPSELLDVFEDWEPRYLSKWMDRNA